MNSSLNENLVQEDIKPLEKPTKTGLEISLSGSPEVLGELSDLADAINHDRAVTSEDILRLKDSIKDAKIKLGNMEVTVEQAEQTYGSFGSFLKETWKILGVDEEKIKDAKISLEIKSPKDEYYATRSVDIDETKFGQFTLNPDTQGLDWESLKGKIFIPNLSSLDGWPIKDVIGYLITNFSGKYIFPGIEYWKFMVENLDKVPNKLKDGNWYYNFGSLVRRPGGRWGVPGARWDESEWSRDVFCLVGSWGSNCRVVLLEK